MRKVSAVLILPAVTLAIAGCGSSKTSGKSGSPGARSAASAASGAPATGGVEIASRTIPALGSALVDAHGRTLYVFSPDNQTRPTCVSLCASEFFPALLRSGQKAVAAGAVKQSLLGSDPYPTGGQVITYAGWPLYTYSEDSAPGQATGQALNVVGRGLFYVISPSGSVNTTTGNVIVKNS